MGRVASPARKRASVESPPAVDPLRKGCRLRELRQMREEGRGEEEETASRAHFITLTRLAVR